MSIISDIRSDVKRIAVEKGYGETELGLSKAFGYWYLINYEAISPEYADDMIIDGPWDHGCDALNFDDRVLTIYQFKYTDDPIQVSEAYSQIQEALIFYEDKLSECNQVDLFVVSLSKNTPRLKADYTRTFSLAKKWLAENHYDYLVEEIDIIPYHIDEFIKSWEKIIGINLTLKFQQCPITTEDSIIGIFNAKDLKKYALNDKDDLFAFNIRQFLGFKGNVNKSIKATLDDTYKSDIFWKLNNGLVCLCTDFESGTNNKWEFKNFTIVNGAQTISTIAKYFEKNRLADKAKSTIWVLAKIIKVSEGDVDFARLLTISSNSQNSTKNQDIRAIIKSHKIIREWMGQFYDIGYKYKRGDNPDGDYNIIIDMKDICQAYIAQEKPYISYARLQTIFQDDGLFKQVYDEEEVDKLKARGNEEDIRCYLLKRIIPTLILNKVRLYLSEKAIGEDLRYKSIAHHIVWIYYQAFIQLNIKDLNIIFEKLDDIIDGSIDDIYSGFIDYMQPLEQTQQYVIPRDLKNDRITELLLQQNKFIPRWLIKVNEKIYKIIK